MSASVRVLIVLLAAGALASCVRNPDSVSTEGQASTATGIEPETVVMPRDYFGRTEFEIPGGDGQVVDYTFG